MSKSFPSPTNSETPQNSFSASALKALARRYRRSRAVGRRASLYQPGTLIRPFTSRRVIRAWMSRHAGFGAIAAYEECWSTFAVRLQSDREGGPAFFVCGNRAEPGVAAHPGPDDPPRREGPDQGARLVQGCPASDRPRAAVPARERLQGRCAEGVLGRLRIRRGRERLRHPPPSDLLTHLHDLRLRERVHRTRHEDRESRGGEGEDRFPSRPEHEAGETVREATGSSDRERLRGHRTEPREGGPRGGRHLPECPGRESRDQGIRRCIRTRAGGLAVVGGRLHPRVLQRSGRRALHLRTRGFLRRLELSRAERALPHGGLRRRLETHGRDVRAHVSRPTVPTRSSRFLAYLYLEVRMRRSTPPRPLAPDHVARTSSRPQTLKARRRFASPNGHGRQSVQGG